MAWTYVELYRGEDPSNWVGHVARIFDDGVVPAIPEAGSRLVRIECTNRTAAQIRAFLDQGIGRFKLNLLSAAIRTQIEENRSYSANAAQLASAFGVDRSPAALPAGTRKMRVKMDLPNKPNGSWFIKEPGSRIYTCLTDPDCWLEGDLVEAAAALVPVKPTAAQGYDFEEVS